MNRYPELKKFLNNDISNYQDIQIIWIRGTDPTLTVIDNGVEIEEIKLGDYNSKSAMEELLHSKGFSIQEQSNTNRIYSLVDNDPIEVSFKKNISFFFNEFGFYTFIYVPNYWNCLITYCTV